MFFFPNNLYSQPWLQFTFFSAVQILGSYTILVDYLPTAIERNANDRYIQLLGFSLNYESISDFCFNIESP